MRLAETVARLKERLRAAQPALNTDVLLQQLAADLQRNVKPATLRWVRASVGQTVRLIAVDDIDFLRSDEKYTLVAWRDDARQPREAVIRMPLKELAVQLDPSQFAQVHRSVVVNLRAISHVTRGHNETAEIHLKGRDRRAAGEPQLPASVPADVMRRLLSPCERIRRRPSALS